jgi:hypothetical protein
MKLRFGTVHLIIFFVTVASAQTLQSILAEIPACAVRFLFFAFVIALARISTITFMLLALGLANNPPARMRHLGRRIISLYQRPDSRLRLC